VLPRDYLRARKTRRARRGIGFNALELLEGRQLMAYTSLGFSLADVAISGVAAPETNWGDTLTIAMTVQNTGASTIVEPLSLVPPSQVQVGPDGRIVPSYQVPSRTDAVGMTIGVYLVPNGRHPAGGIKIGEIAAPDLPQNSIQRFDATVTLPERPAGFPAAGNFSIRLVANENRAVLESNYRNNLSAPIPVRVLPAPATPALRAVTLDLPANLQPGDTVFPFVQISNIGTGAIPPGVPVEVALVASTSPDFNLGSSIVSVETIDTGIPGINNTPGPRRRGPKGAIHAVRNSIYTPNNIVSFQGPLATLPTSPDSYFIGIVIDPENKLNLPNQPANRLELIHTVQARPDGGSGGVISAPKILPFQNPPDGQPIGIV